VSEVPWTLCDSGWRRVLSGNRIRRLGSGGRVPQAGPAELDPAICWWRYYLEENTGNGLIWKPDNQ